MSRSMRVALLISELTWQGGTERQAVQLAAELQAMGVDVTVFTSAFNAATCYPDITARLNVVTAGRHPLATRLPSRRLQGYFDMQRLSAALTGHFDVLNPHHWPAHWAATTAIRQLSGRPPVVWMCNDDPWPPTLFTPTPWWAPGRSFRRLLHRLAYRYDQSAVSRVDRIAVLDSRMAERVREGYGREPDVVRSGVDVERLGSADPEAVRALRRRLNIPERAFLLLFAGILMPHRRLEDVIQALAAPALRERGVQLLIVGAQDQYLAYARRLKDSARELGLADRITWTGAVPEADLPTYYHACDAFIFANEEQTWGLAVTEAMACRKPVIVSTGAGVHEVLSDGQNALLVPPRRPEAIAGAVGRLLADEPLRCRLATEGRQFVETRLSWRRYAESMVTVFEEAVTARRGVLLDRAAVEA